jgi:hypothetical protein
MPSSWAGVLVFLLVVAPGLLFDICADRRRATAKQSAFREIGRITLASVVFGGVAFVGVLGAASIFPAAFAWPFAVLESDDAVSQFGAKQLAATLGLQTALALGFAFLGDILLGRRSKSRLRAISAWSAIFRESKPDDLVAHVRVKLKSGTTWEGHMGPYSADLETAGRELVLQKPLRSAAPGSSKTAPVPAAWERVVLAGDEIDWIAVKYVASLAETGPVDASTEAPG